MEKRNETVKALGGTLLALLIAVGILFVADAVFSFRNLADTREEAAMVMGQIFVIHTTLSFAMLLLSFYLSFIYLKDYFQLKSKFTLGLLAAVFSFMMFALTANPLIHVILGVYGGKGIFSLIPYLFATISLGILVWVSSK